MRINDELWQAAQTKASESGITVSDAIRSFLQAWVDGDLTLT